MAAEVLPFVPDAWVDHTKTKVGYEIPLTRHFYRYVPPRPLAEIDAEIKQLEGEIQALLARGDRVSEAWPRVALPQGRSTWHGTYVPAVQHPEYWVDCTIPWLTLADVGPLRAGTVQTVSATKEKISLAGSRQLVSGRAPVGDGCDVPNGVGRFQRHPGRAMATSQDYVTWRCGPWLDATVSAAWLLHVARRRDPCYAMGSTHQTHLHAATSS